MCTSRRMWLEGASGGAMVWHGVGLRGQGGKVQIGTDREAGDEHIAGEQQVVLRALQAQRGVGQGADAVRIADANALAGDRKVGVDAVLVGQETGHAQQAAAAHGGERLDFKAVLVEFERAVQLAEAVGNVFEREGAVLEVDAALQPGIRQRAMGLDLEGGGSAGGQVGIEGLGQLEVDGAAGGKVQLALCPSGPGCPGRADRSPRR